MNDIFLNPYVALAVVIGIYVASFYSAVLGVWTVYKLPRSRDVARAVSLMIAIVGILAIVTGSLSYAQGCSTGPIQLSQMVDLLNIMINVLVLRLFLRPCYVDETCQDGPKKCRELS